MEKIFNLHDQTRINILIDLCCLLVIGLSYQMHLCNGLHLLNVFLCLIKYWGHDDPLHSLIK